MDEQTVRAALRHYWEHSATDADVAHEVYHTDAVLEFPQSGERFEGVANFKGWRRDYPADVEFEIGRVRGAQGIWVVEGRIRYDGGQWNHGVAIYQFRGDKVVHETIYYAEGWEAPEWRARWRATPS